MSEAETGSDQLLQSWQINRKDQQIPPAAGLGVEETFLSPSKSDHIQITRTEKSRLEMPKFPVPKHILRWMCCEMDPNVVYDWVNQ